MSRASRNTMSVSDGASAPQVENISPDLEALSRLEAALREIHGASRIEEAWAISRRALGHPEDGK